VATLILIVLFPGMSTTLPALLLGR
jgi:hypothetical protein